MTVGNTLLYEVLAEKESYVKPEKLSAEELQRLNKQFKDVRGYDARENWMAVMEGAPDFFEAYTGKATSTLLGFGEKKV